VRRTTRHELINREFETANKLALLINIEGPRRTVQRAHRYGDAYLRTYGDFMIHLPNSTIIVRDQWLDNPSGLAAMGPVVSLTDYPGPPSSTSPT
jgi:hypothetical protein